MVSDVWEYCTRISDTLVKCNHCGKVMSFHGTTNIRVHVGRHFGMKPTRCRSTARLPPKTSLMSLQPGATNQLEPLQSPGSSPRQYIKKTTSPPPQQLPIPAILKKMPVLAPRPQAPKEAPKLVPKPAPKPSPPPEVCLRWNSYHSNMQNTFPSLLNNEQFVDVTLACDGRSIKCHKVMLSACSPYMEELLSSNPCQHPIIFLKDMKFWQLAALVDFMYRGEVNVTQDKLPSLLAAAEALQIKGLASPVHTASPTRHLQEVDSSDAMNYLRQFQSEVKCEEPEYMQDTDDEAPPTPKPKKRKLTETPSSCGQSLNGKKQREKERSSISDTPTGPQTTHTPTQQRQLQRDSTHPTPNLEYKDCKSENINNGNQNEELDIDDEQAQIILQQYSQQDETYSRDGEEESTESG